MACTSAPGTAFGGVAFTNGNDRLDRYDVNEPSDYPLPLTELLDPETGVGGGYR
jgi:hypothetical protein